MGRDLVVETNLAVTKLLGCGVEHGDVRPPNVLWNPESKKVMLVDFERSILQEITPNRKRKNLHVTEGALCSGAKPQILADRHTRSSLGKISQRKSGAYAIKLNVVL